MPYETAGVGARSSEFGLPLQGARLCQTGSGGDAPAAMREGVQPHEFAR